MMSVTAKINKQRDRIEDLEHLICQCFEIRDNGMLLPNTQQIYRFKKQIEEVINGYK